MVNICDKKNFERKCRIDEVSKIFLEIKNKNLEVIDEKTFILQIADKYSVTYRKAKEYLQIAKFKTNEKMQDL